MLCVGGGGGVVVVVVVVGAGDVEDSLYSNAGDVYRWKQDLNGGVDVA